MNRCELCVMLMQGKTSVYGYWCDRYKCPDYLVTYNADFIEFKDYENDVVHKGSIYD